VRRRKPQNPMQEISTINVPTVIKRDGTKVLLDVNQIWYKYGDLIKRYDIEGIDLPWLVKLVIQGLRPEITTREIDALAEHICATKNPIDGGYHKLAMTIRLSNLYRTIPLSWYESLKMFAIDGEMPLKGLSPSPEIVEFARDHQNAIDEAIVEAQERMDKNLEYAQLCVLENQYMLLRADGSVGELPQHMWMRVAVALAHLDGLPSVLTLFERISQYKVCLPTPVLRTAGTYNKTHISCFLASARDSVDHMYDMVKEFAICSKMGGGFGLSVSAIRSTGAAIKTTGGEATGLVKYLKVFGQVRKHVKQGSNKRSGTCASYCEPWHADFVDFFQIRSPTVEEKNACKDVFPVAWMPDLFFKRVDARAQWSFFNPDDVQDLLQTYGEEFESRYIEHERAGRALSTMPALDLLHLMTMNMMLCGGPGVMGKDAVNELSTYNHIAKVDNGNLCEEIVIPSIGDAKGCCVLGAVGLPAHVTPSGKFDMPDFLESVRLAVRYVDRLNDMTTFPTPEDRQTHLKYRPIGVGVSGLADVFAMCSIPFDSEAARVMNYRIFEWMHYVAVDESSRMAAESGCVQDFAESNLAKGLLHPALFDARWKRLNPGKEIWRPKNLACGDKMVGGSVSPPWEDLADLVSKNGVRNLHVNALMPTASSSAAVQNNECFEPFTSNCYARNLQSGYYYFANRHLIKRLKELDLLNAETLEVLRRDRGSVRNVPGLPAHDISVFATAWELRQKALLQLACDRQRFVDQSISWNVFIAEPTNNKVATMLMDAWRGGAKCMLYYLRTQPAAVMLTKTEIGTYEALESEAQEEEEGGKNAPTCSRGGCSL